MDVASYLLGQQAGGGSGGTSNYNELSNKPQINNVELSGNKTASDLGLVSPTDYATNSKGGVIKYDSTYGLYVNQNGALYGAEKSYANYENFSSNGIISKGTLENVIIGKQLVNQTDISGKLDTSAVKTSLNTTQGNVYDVTYINSLIGGINTILATLTTPSNNGGNE